MRKPLRLRRAGLATKVRLALLNQLQRRSLLGIWSIERRLFWALETYWYGDIRGALEILSEIADEEELFSGETTVNPCPEQGTTKEECEDVCHSESDLPGFLSISAKGDRRV